MLFVSVGNCVIGVITRSTYVPVRAMKIYRSALTSAPFGGWRSSVRLDPSENSLFSCSAENRNQNSSEVQSPMQSAHEH